MAAGAAIAMAPAVSGCLNDAQFGLCTETVLVVEDVTVPDGRTPPTLVAHLTTEDGEPVVGLGVEFFEILSRRDGGAPPSAETVGGVATDAGGVARHPLSSGVNKRGFRSERMTGYKASFRPIGTIDGVTYCQSSSGDAAVVVQGAEPEGPAGVGRRR